MNIICEKCGHIQPPRAVATHVLINGTLYILGQTSQRNAKIACIRGGLAHMVCYWEPDGIAPNTTIIFNGNKLEFLP